jgi:tight adherence protein B
MTQEMILFGSIAMVVLLLFLGLADLILGQNRKMKKRIAHLRQRMGAELPDIARQESVLRENKTASPGLDKVVKRFLPSAEVLNQRLARAGLVMGPGSFIGIAVVLGLFAAVMLNGFFGFGPAVSILGGIGIGLGFVHLVIDILIARRSAAFSKTFPDALDLIVRAVKSGLPVSEGITIISNEMEGPVRDEFANISEAMKIGETMDSALWETAKRLENAEFNFFVISLVVQSETGGNLAETLSNLSDILRQRKQMKLKVNALASEARASAYILGCLPFFMVAILEVMSPGYTEPLYTDPTGIKLTIGALISISIGALIMFKMVRFEV